MNTGIFGENFPYSNFHDLNMDWIIKIVKDFLEQYTSIQELISDGESAISTEAQESIAEIQSKLEEAEGLLQQAYNGYSSEVDSKIAEALATLTASVNSAYATLSTQIDNKATETLASIPSDYTTLSNTVTALNTEVQNVIAVNDITDNIMMRVNFIKGTLSNGSEYPATNRIRSNFVDISEYETITGSVASGFKFEIDWFDASKNYISATGWKTTETTPTIPSTAKYLRLLIANTSDSSVSLTNQRKLTLTAKYKINSIITKTINTETNMRNISDEVTLPWTIGYVYDSGDLAVTDQPNYMCTQPILSFPFGIAITPANGYQVSVKFFASNADTIEFAEPWSYDTVFIPANSRFSCNASKTTPELISDLDEYISKIKVNTYSDYSLYTSNKSLKMSVLGDSTSAFQGYCEAETHYYPSTSIKNYKSMWWYQVAQKIGSSVIDVSAISRSAFRDTGESGRPPMYDDTRIARLASNGTPDIIFVFAGINDAFVSQDTPIQYEYTVSALNNLENTTLRGIALTIRKLQTAYPNAKIVMLIPHESNIANMASGSGYSFERVSKVADLIKTYSEFYGVWKVIDLRECGINYNNVATYTEDNAVHPNAKGMYKIAKHIIDNL